MTNVTSDPSSARPWEHGNEVLLATLDEVGMPKRIVNELPTRGITLVGHLIQQLEPDLLDLPNMGRTSLAEAKTILARYSLQFGTKLPRWDDTAAGHERKRLGRGIQRRIAELGGEVVQPAVYLEEELMGFLQAVEAGQNVGLLATLHGFDGTEPKTLEAVGQAYGLTRERVRQLNERARKRLSNRWYATPRLTAALACVRELAPCSAKVAGEAIAGRGISRSFVHPSTLLAGAEFVGAHAGFIEFAISRNVLFGSETARQFARGLAGELRQATQAGGCSSVERLALAVDVGLDETDRVRRVLEALDEVVWLDAGRTWVMSNRPTRNRLVNYAEKVFAATPQVGLGELRLSLSRPHRLHYVPSAEAVAAIVERSGLARRSGDNMIRVRDPGEACLGLNDSAILHAFRKLGSPLSREQLEAACIDDFGVNANSFYVHLSYSPLVSKLSVGVYGLVGADIAIGSVERVKAEHLATRVPQEHGWTPTGKLWLMGKLDRISAKLGSRTIPSYVAGLTGGRWRLVVAGGLEAGEVRIDNGFMTGLKNAFVLLGAEPDDYALFTFDLMARTLLVRLGGMELADDQERDDPIFDAAEAEGFSDLGLDDDDGAID